MKVIDHLAGIVRWQPVLGTPADVLSIVIFVVKLNVEPGTFPHCLEDFISTLQL